MWPFSKRPVPLNAAEREVVSLYHFHAAPFHHPGTGNIVFDPKFSTALFPFAGGHGNLTLRALRSTQGPQSLVGFNIKTSGIGGLVAGQMALQPLVDPKAKK